MNTRRSTGQAVVSGASGAGSRPAASSPATRAPRSSRKARRSAKAAYVGSVWISPKTKSQNRSLKGSRKPSSWISWARPRPPNRIPIQIPLMALEDAGRVSVRRLLPFLMPKSLVPNLILIYHSPCHPEPSTGAARETTLRQLIFL